MCVGRSKLEADGYLEEATGEEMTAMKGTAAA